MANLREPKGTIAYEVKTLPLHEINEVIQSFDLLTTPREHQARALYLGIAHDTVLFSLDMGLGKTLIGLYLTSIGKELGDETRTLVTCPPIVMRQWRKEVAKHTKMSVTLVDDDGMDAKLGQLERTQTDVTVVSHPWITTLFSKASKDKNLERHLIKLFKKFTMLVVDEAHVLKNPETKGFQGYRKYLLGIKRRYLMTGTPTGNDYTGVWSLYYILDKGQTFGRSYNIFLREYFNVFDRGRYLKYTLKSERRKEFMTLFWRKNIRWEEGQCNDLPGKTFTTLPVSLTPEQARKYDTLLTPADGQIYEPGDEPVFDLMRVTAGIGLKNSPKLEAVKSLIQDVCIDNQRQFIIWCWLRDESDYLKEEIRKKFKKLTVETIRGDGTRATKDKILDEWARGNVHVLIANPKSLGIGVDLYEANACCFFSNNRSLIDRKQTEKRIHRTGQTRHCTYIDIVCENTIDELNLKILNKAKDGFSEITRDSSNIWEDLKKQRALRS